MMRQKKSFHISLPKLRLSKKRFLFICVIAVFVAGIASVYFLFKIQSISVYGLDKNESIRGLSPFYQKHIFLVSEEEIGQAVKRNNPSIKSVEVLKRLPDSVQIRVTKNKPFAVLAIAEGYFTLSEDARILKKERELSSSLPLVKHYQKFSFSAYKVGDYLAFSDIQKTLKFIEALETFPYKLDTIDIEGTNMIACNLIIGTSKSTILFSSEKDYQQQVYEVTTILRKFSQDKKSFKKLDLRFNRPVVEF